MIEWEKSVKKSLKEWLDLAYNVHSASRDHWSYDDITMMPIKDLLSWVDFISPKLKEEMKRQEAEQMKAELTGQRRGRPAMNRRNKER